MITVITGTNRKGNLTQHFAKYIYHQLKAKNVDVKYLSLEKLNGDIITEVMYGDRSERFEAIQKEYLLPTTKYVLLMPEYNGSFPGILKLLIDGSDVANCFYHKKACLIGTAAGRAGNLRGIDHMIGIFNHMKMSILPGEVPLSSINAELDENGNLINEVTKSFLNSQVDAIINF